MLPSLLLSWGLIPRSLSKILTASNAMRKNGWEWSLQVGAPRTPTRAPGCTRRRLVPRNCAWQASFLEIYNEQLRDLLHDKSQPVPSYAIKHEKAWGTVVANASRFDVASMDQINALMARAAKQRAVGSTDMNAQSSRSHSVFALYLKGTNAELGSELHGALHLVDLAGSERLDKSGATGAALKETQAINASLSTLASVFSAKATGQKHVPFRDSKLTFLMEPCLSGQARAAPTSCQRCRNAEQQHRHCGMRQHDAILAAPPVGRRARHSCWSTWRPRGPTRTSRSARSDSRSRSTSATLAAAARRPSPSARSGRLLLPPARPARCRRRARQHAQRAQRPPLARARLDASERGCQAAWRGSQLRSACVGARPILKGRQDSCTHAANAETPLPYVQACRSVCSCARRFVRAARRDLGLRLLMHVVVGTRPLSSATGYFPAVATHCTSRAAYIALGATPERRVGVVAP